MDSDDRYRQQYRASTYQSSEDISGNPPYNTSPSTEHTRQYMHQSSRRDISASEAASNPSAPSYGSYPYGENQPYVGSAVPSGNMPFQEEGYAGGAARQQQTQPSHQRQQQPQQQSQQPHQPQYPSYPTSMVYGMGQQAGSQSQFQPVPQYQSRQAASVDIPGQFGAPQYYGTGASSTGGIPAVSPYIAPQVEGTAFPQQGAGERMAVPQSYSATVAEYEQRAPSSTRQPLPGGESDTTGVAYERFQIRVRLTFEHIRAGRLEEASHELLTISEWLLREDVLEDAPEIYQHRMDFWEQFNLAWLACGQRQVELSLQRGPQSPGLLSLATIRNMGNKLTELCGKLEPHGLVDYQMGVWEEEIIAVLLKCRDLLEGDGAQPPAEGSSSIRTSLSRP